MSCKTASKAAICPVIYLYLSKLSIAPDVTPNDNDLSLIFISLCNFNTKSNSDIISSSFS
ncbi:uncharacterized protein METZ01_LOCUS243853, partial [marine metagenome]